ncbi:ABC transporter permease [Ornithinimicrobium humiphilum]|uniref:ABC-2 type transport system permease protein n=1 Tax=Ornithinimicrobium humiphilum TaxID=125288 RepID=A0A543KL09_9MICO|nr:ABC transporter permease [Ornithinimicrobium humiphilum]TQM95769.1 ABC-2 type transport system permease protein [Ornithinimicrobium humiphilum]
MNTTYTALELRRTTRNYVSMFFIAVLPAFFYVVFGAAQDFGAEPIGNGNVTFYVMVSMAAYGAVTATVSIGGMAAVERMQGWGRQLGLTPMKDREFVLSKVLVALGVAAVPVALIFLLGSLTGAEAPPLAWLLSAAIALGGAGLFAIYGLCFGLAFRSEAAAAAASGSLVVLAFLGNIFFPLSGSMLTIARFTPLYGVVTLARHPLTGGDRLDGTAGGLVHEALWIPVANVVVWTILLGLTAVWLVRRSRARQ